MPWIIPGVVVALIWEFIYQPNYGLLNDILSRMGCMTERVAWLSSPALAMPAVIATNVWRGMPFFAIMLLAGLQAIPTELYEAARVDGASVVQRFRHVTLPYAAAHHRRRHRHADRLDVQLRRPHLRHDQRRPRQRHPDHVDATRCCRRTRTSISATRRRCRSPSC